MQKARRHRFYALDIILLISMIVLLGFFVFRAYERFLPIIDSVEYETVFNFGDIKSRALVRGSGIQSMFLVKNDSGEMIMRSFPIEKRPEFGKQAFSFQPTGVLPGAYRCKPMGLFFMGKSTDPSTRMLVIKSPLKASIDSRIQYLL